MDQTEINDFRKLITKTRSAITEIEKTSKNTYTLGNFREIITNIYNQTAEFVSRHPEFQADFKDVSPDIPHKNPISFESGLKIIRIFLDGVENSIIDSQGTELPNEFVILQGKAFTASKIIQSILGRSTSSIKIVDNYMSGDSVQVIENANRERDIYIITKEASQNFIEAIETAKRGWGGKIEVRESKSFHDRYLILDDKEVWMCGPSIDYLGVKKPGIIVQVREPSVSGQIIDLFKTVWNSAIVKI